MGNYTKSEWQLAGNRILLTIEKGVDRVGVLDHIRTYFSPSNIYTFLMK